ncbi:hypothetical protein Y032_0022g491 [Ancylostoma ceylanicum]|uniref:Uncharacterized protein n=1 Tax=Ancylostoma ceylanicum TaxID=53326 RepID=A0A016UXP4_9BILA|nr:hypothetical protein Y032_0022g491 [Ancylostoma ceylanicum]
MLDIFVKIACSSGFLIGIGQGSVLILMFISLSVSLQSLSSWLNPVDVLVIGNTWNTCDVFPVRRERLIFFYSWTQKLIKLLTKRIKAPENILVERH